MKKLNFYNHLFQLNSLGTKLLPLIAFLMLTLLNYGNYI